MTVSSSSVFVIITPQSLLSDHYCLLIAGLNYRVSHVGAGGSRTRAHFSAQGRLDCAAVKTRDGEKKRSGRGDHNGVGVTFICTQNGVCVGPGPPSLILYQLTPTPHPQTHTNTAEEETNSRLTLFFSSPFTPPLLSLFLHPLLSRDLLHSSG